MLNGFSNLEFFFNTLRLAIILDLLEARHFASYKIRSLNLEIRNRKGRASEIFPFKVESKLNGLGPSQINESESETEKISISSPG